MRIAHIVPRGEQPWSGVLTVISHLSAALSLHGLEVEVWQLDEWDGSFAEHRRTLDEAGVARFLVGAGQAWWNIGPVVDSQVRQRHIDIVHLHGAFNVWNMLISRKLRHPFVISPHSGYDPISLRRSRRRKAVYGALFERPMLQRAALVVALTEIELGQLAAYGVNAPKTVIPNGVTLPAKEVDPARFRRELGIGSKSHLAVFVGRLDVHRKGLDVLVRGLAEAPAWHLALVGPGFRGVGRLRAMIHELGLRSRVHFKGVRYGERLHEALAAADVFALLSRWEGLPMALLESLSFGKPAIVSAAVDRLIDVEAAGAGWVADGKRLAEVLDQCAAEGSDEDEQHRRGEAARRLAERYDWDVVSRQYEKAYGRAFGQDAILRG